MPFEQRIKLDSSVKKQYPELVTGYAVVHGLKIEKTINGLEEAKRKVFGELKRKYAGIPTTEIPDVEFYRKFYKAMGVDTSKLKPPTEYLLQRAIEDRFPRIDNLVDSCLLATVQHLIIIGVYDLDRIKGEPKVTLVSKTESFETIDGRHVTPTIGEVVLRDDKTIISAYTVGDAKATMITPQTKNALIIAWNAPGIDKSKVDAALASIEDYVINFCYGKIIEHKLLAS